MHLKDSCGHNITELLSLTKGGNCDFCSPSHSLKEDDTIVVSHTEVRIYQEAYAIMFYDQTPIADRIKLNKKMRQAILTQGLSLAKGEPVIFEAVDMNDGTKRNVQVNTDSDWATCSKGLRKWEEYKSKYPKVAE